VINDVVFLPVAECMCQELWPNIPSRSSVSRLCLRMSLARRRQGMNITSSLAYFSELFQLL